MIIDLLTNFFQITALASVPFGLYGVIALAVQVIPRQLKERKVKDDIIKTRRRLPVLTIIFCSLAFVAVLNILNNILSGHNDPGLINSMMRTVVLQMIFIKCLTWKLIYTDFK